MCVKWGVWWYFSRSKSLLNWPRSYFFSFSRGGRSGDTSTSFFKVTYMSTIQISKLSPLLAAVKSFELFSDWLNSKRCFSWVEMCCLYFVIRWKKGGPTWQKSVLCTMFKNLPKCLISNNLTQPTHFVVCILKLVSPNSNILKLTSPKSPQYPTSYPTRPLNLALDR